MSAMPGPVLSYLSSVIARDPAARSRAEIIIYPGTWAVALHRVAHPLYKARFYFIARFINHFARWLTGIDIHPGAQIGRNFFADHGWIVIGETAVVGADVTIYSGVTLGGSRPTTTGEGKRHPSIGDRVVIGSGAQIIGPVRIASDARIGSNAVVTRDVRHGEVVVGIPAKPISKRPGDWSKAEAAQHLAEAKDEIDRLGHLLRRIEEAIERGGDGDRRPARRRGAKRQR
jgi:serine O-acetyltransferase